MPNKTSLPDDQIKILFHQGLGSRNIAKKLGIKHPSTVYKRLRKLGLKRGICVADNEDLRKIKSRFENQEKSLARAAEHYARYFFTIMGFTIMIPEPGAPFDLVVDFGDGFKKIQIKTSKAMVNSGNFEFSLIRTRNNSTCTRKIKYLKDECDYFFLFDIESRAWLIPFEKLKGVKSVTPALRYPGYKIK